jgi:hypothetical protein
LVVLFDPSDAGALGMSAAGATPGLCGVDTELADVAGKRRIRSERHHLDRLEI